MTRRTVEEIFVNDVVKPFKIHNEKNEKYSLLVQEYQRLERKLLEVNTYIEKKVVVEEIEKAHKLLNQHLEEFGEPSEFSILPSVYEELNSAYNREIHIAYHEVEDSVRDMLTVLKEAAEKYEDVLEKQLKVETLRNRMVFMKNTQLDSRNIKSINLIRHAATNYTKRGTLNYANTPEHFGSVFTKMLANKTKNEKAYREDV